MATFRGIAAILLIALLSACASLPPQTGRNATHALTDTDSTQLGAAFVPQERKHPDSSAFHLLPNGVDALLARIVLADAAERTLDLQYYIWHDDLTGRHLADAVLKAADRGVRVRVLLDDLGTGADDEVLLAAGVHLYELKPVAGEHNGEKKKSILGSSKASLHAKTYVFDRTSVFIGSMNLDPRSITLNTEIGVYCESAPLAAQVAAGLEPKLDQIAWRLETRTDANGTSRIVWIDTAPDGTATESDEPGVSGIKRVGIWFLGLLPIESEL